MSIMSAIVLYAMLWFLTLFIVLPLRTRTQGEAGDVVPGTHSSAPENAQMAKTARITTYWATGAFVGDFGNNPVGRGQHECCRNLHRCSVADDPGLRP